MKIEVKVSFTFEELSAAAQETAVEQVRERLAGPWWDTTDTDSIGETILYVLAGKLAAPGWDTYGEGDFPGLRNVKVQGWDVDQAMSLDLDGTLTPDTAPGLPWPDDCDRFRLGATESRWTGNTRGLWIADSYPQWPADTDRADVQAFLAAWDDAVQTALLAGRDEMEHKCSAEYAREWLDANTSGLHFTEDGDIA